MNAKNLMQTTAKFCEVFAHLPPFYVHKIVPRYLSVVRVLLSIDAPPHFYCVLPICKRKKVEKPYFRSRFINVKDTWNQHFQLGKEKIVNTIQHTRFCLSMYCGAICIFFINQACTLYIAFDKCLYICDVVQSGADLPLGWKGLCLGPPISRSRTILGVRKISSISESNYICIFVLVQHTFFLLCR